MIMLANRFYNPLKARVASSNLLARQLARSSLSAQSAFPRKFSLSMSENRPLLTWLRIAIVRVCSDITKPSRVSILTYDLVWPATHYL